MSEYPGNEKYNTFSWLSSLYNSFKSNSLIIAIRLFKNKFYLTFEELFFFSDLPSPLLSFSLFLCCCFFVLFQESILHLSLIPPFKPYIPISVQKTTDKTWFFFKGQYSAVVFFILITVWLLALLSKGLLMVYGWFITGNSPVAKVP